MTASQELSWRGFIHQTTYPSIETLDGDPITFYWGVDPSADSMTVGHLAAAMMVKCLMKHGHRPVLLVGGATGLIGDPDGKSSERELISFDTVQSNKAALAEQYKHLFGGGAFKIVDNYDWFKDMHYLEFLRDVGKHVPMRQMLGRDFVSSRLGESGAGISYAEFSYVLIQAYDFLYQNQNYDVSLQVCGADQWGNSVAGVDLIRRLTGKEAHVLSTPLIINRATGRKFGKTESGAVWLDPNKTTPTQFYQFWMNVDDLDVEGYLKVFTELDQQVIEDVVSRHQADPKQRLAQERLAAETTALVHDQAAMELARSVTAFLTGARSIGEADDATVEEIRKNIPSLKTTNIVEALVSGGLASSNTEARRLLQGQAISVNGKKYSAEVVADEDLQNGRALIRRGKAFKDTVFIEH